jgi:eukaryotic-like serine/threonine-protein kinase
MLNQAQTAGFGRASRTGNCTVSESDLRPDLSLTPGALLQGRYRLTRELGRGPVSVVYLGQDHHREDEVVLKVLDLTVADRAKVRQEVLATWEVAHDHVVAVRGCFEISERCCVVMDHAAGPSLDRRVALERLTTDEAAAVGRGVALGLQAAHRRGILHRHVNPSNILIAAEVRARLTDFGCAGYGLRDNKGARDYRAPEVLAGQAADARADVYGLGLSLYFALTGELPARQVPERPTPASADGHRPSRLLPVVPPWLDDAIARATAALPADRFNSAGRLAEALAPRSRAHAAVGDYR